MFAVFVAVASIATSSSGICIIVSCFVLSYFSPKLAPVSVCHFSNVYVYPSTSCFGVAVIVILSPYLYFVSIFVFDCVNLSLSVLVPVDIPFDVTCSIFSPAVVVNVYLALL